MSDDLVRKLTDALAPELAKALGLTADLDADDYMKYARVEKCVRVAAEVVREHVEGLERENETLRGEVREWLCALCNCVYPGPPQPGVHCVVCPECGGDTAPKTVIERRAAEEQVSRLRTALAVYADEENWRVEDWGVIAIFGVDYGKPWTAARAALADSPREPEGTTEQ